MLYFAGSNNYDNMANRYNGVIAAMLFICMIGSLRPYDGPMKSN